MYTCTNPESNFQSYTRTDCCSISIAHATAFASSFKFTNLITDAYSDSFAHSGTNRISHCCTVASTYHQSHRCAFSCPHSGTICKPHDYTHGGAHGGAHGSAHGSPFTGTYCFANGFTNFEPDNSSIFCPFCCAECLANS